MFIILGKTSTRVVLAPALLVRTYTGPEWGHQCICKWPSIIGPSAGIVLTVNMVKLNMNFQTIFSHQISWISYLWSHIIQNGCRDFMRSHSTSIFHSLGPGCCFTDVSRALQNNLTKIHNGRNHISRENFKLKLCTCAQSMALGTCTKFQLEILIRNEISAKHKFRENILESSRNNPVIGWA